MFNETFGQVFLPKNWLQDKTNCKPIQLLLISEYKNYYVKCLLILSLRNMHEVFIGIVQILHSNINHLVQVKVMHQQLVMFHNATLAYFSNNHQVLETTLKQFYVKPKSPTAPSVAASWLEK